jgi:hypothetical protein
MYQWQDIMQEADTLAPSKLSFLFYFHPKDEKELKYLLKRDRMEYPVFIDEQDKLNKLNNFPQDAMYQCFLLDTDNKVAGIGNPVLNPKIWELYKRIITGAKEDRQKI